MRKTVATLLVVAGIAVIVAGLSIQAFPEWLSLPGGLLLLVAAAFIGVADLGGKLKDWRDFLFGEEKQAKKSSSSAKPDSQRTQEMTLSKNGQQEMHGRGGVQKQKMTVSPSGKQKME